MFSVIKISLNLNTSFECPHPRLEFCHKSKQYDSETLTSNFVLLYDYRSTSSSCWRYLTFYVSYWRQEDKKLKESIFCKVTQESKKKKQFKNSVFLLAFSIYQWGDYESMWKDTFEFAKKQYLNDNSDTRSVQENFDLLTSFIQDSADKHIPSKISRFVSSIPWITPEIRRKIHRKNKTHAKA